jgi:hypothetical protein
MPGSSILSVCNKITCICMSPALLSSSSPPPYLLSFRSGSFRYVTSAEPPIRVCGGEREVKIERRGGRERDRSCLAHHA